MAKQDPYNAKVYKVQHDGVGAVGVKGPWNKGHLIVRDHFGKDEEQHLTRLIDIGAITPAEDEDLEGIDVDRLSANPWTDNPNVNREAEEARKRAYNEARAGRNADESNPAIPVQPENPPGAAGHRVTTGTTDLTGTPPGGLPAQVQTTTDTRGKK